MDVVEQYAQQAYDSLATASASAGTAIYDGVLEPIYKVAYPIIEVVYLSGDGVKHAVNYVGVTHEGNLTYSGMLISIVVCFISVVWLWFQFRASILDIVDMYEEKRKMAASDPTMEDDAEFFSKSEDSQDDVLVTRSNKSPMKVSMKSSMKTSMKSMKTIAASRSTSMKSMKSMKTK